MLLRGEILNDPKHIVFGFDSEQLLPEGLVGEHAEQLHQCFHVGGTIQNGQRENNLHGVI